MELFHHIYKKNNGTSILYAWWNAMHTRIDVVFVGDKTEEEWLSTVSAIFQLIKKIEQIGNFFDPNSELSLMNSSASRAPFLLSDELYEMLTLSKKYALYTDGAFDISIRSLNHASQTLSNVYLEGKTHSAHFRKEGIKLDLCGIIKGYALDKIQEILKENEINDCLINLGNSSVLAFGSQPGKEGWEIGFSNKDFSSNIVLKDECLSMSGNIATGHAHIINPKTGVFISNKKQIAVVTKVPSLGDALSTALYATDEKTQKMLLNDLETKFAQYCCFLK